jgi:hypothetical protein
MRIKFVEFIYLFFRVFEIGLCSACSYKFCVLLVADSEYYAILCPQVPSVHLLL